MKNKILFSIAALLITSGIIIYSCKPNNKSAYISVNNAFQHISHDYLSQEKTKTNSKSLFDIEEKTLEESILLKPINHKSIENEGEIGISETKRRDNPADNIFTVDIEKLYPNSIAILEYELFGLEDFTSVSKSVNDARNFGGLAVSKNNNWTKQREVLNVNDLREGRNIIRFSNYDSLDYNYKIRNLNLRLEPSDVNPSDRRLVVNQPNTTYYFENLGYISGYVAGNDFENAKVYCGEKELRTENGNFEGMLKLNDLDSLKKQAKLYAIFPDGETIDLEVDYEKPNIFDYILEPNNNLEYSSTDVKVNKEFSLSVGQFKLEGQANSLLKKTELRALSLRNIDIPSMGASMQNVTGPDHKGVRMLPHGTQFAKAVKITIPYDTNSLPGGYMAKDIRTYFFDEEIKKWTELPLDTIDEELCLITSYTTHFTDFINGIIKVPESPQTSGFTPTQLSGLDAANPMQGINIISPPQANNSGSANLTYPIQIPQGRNGMQPNLSVNYSSDNGNGWMGVGWDLNIPSIDVETRWGVPRYLPNNETEDYLLNGKQLLYGNANGEFLENNLVHKKKLTSRLTDREYRARIEGDFNKIKRFGSSPNNYYWVVTDRNGTKYYYGKYSSDSGVNSSCVLTDLSGNIASWKLAEVRDLSGNYIKYTYQKKYHQGFAKASPNGVQIYPDSIIYTGHNNEDGKYSIKFIIATANRPDVLINAKKGFKEVTAHRLNRIEIKYKNSFVSEYLFGYRLGAFNKSLLCTAIEVKDSTLVGSIEPSCERPIGLNNSAKQTTFNYYDNDEITYSSEVQIGTQNSGDEIYTNKNISDNHSFGGTVSFGWDPKAYEKSNSIGGNIGGGYSSSKSSFEFIDINGDGLPDILERDGTQITYRLLRYNGNTLEFGPEENLSGIEYLSRSKSTSLDYGGEAQITEFNGGYIRSSSKNTTFGYFTDLNSDGYIDYVSEGEEYYNIPNSNGEPVFINNTSDTIYFAGDPCNYIIRDEVTDPSSYTDEDTLLSNRDAVKVHIVSSSPRLTALPDGSYMFNANDDDFLLYAPIKMVFNEMRDKYSFDDGIRYSIQLNESVIFSDTISPNDTTLHNDSVFELRYLYPGDRIYFRLQSKDNRLFDYVKWDPIINHLDQGQRPDKDIDANGLSAYTRQASEDFLVNNSSSFIAPFQGDIRIRGNITSPPQSDSIEFNLIKNNINIISDIYEDNQQINYHIDTTLSVIEGDEIIIEAYSNTAINLAAIQSDLKIYYYDSDSITIDTLLQYNILEHTPMLKFNYFQNVEYEAINQFIDSNLVNSIIAGNHTINIHLLNPSTSVNGEFILSVKRLNDIVREKTFHVSNGAIVGSDTIQLRLDSIEELYFDFHMHDTLRKDVDYFSVYSNPAIIVGGSDKILSGIHTQMPDSMSKFGNLYQGWGQFSYYSPTNPNDPIDESELYNHDYSVDTTGLTIDTSKINSIDDLENILDSLGTNSLMNTPFMMMFPNVNSNYWYDAINTCKIGKGYFEHGNYLFNNAINISIPGSFAEDTIADGPFVKLANGQYAKSINMFSRSVNHTFSIGASAGGVSGSISEIIGRQESKYSFFDINGDRYPDVVGKEIQYTLPYGAYEPNSKNTNPDDFVSLTNFDGIAANGGVATPYVIKSDKKSYELIGKMGAAIGETSDNTEYSFVDINGDGLADRIKNTGYAQITVQLNEGYSFSNQGTIFINPSISAGTSFSQTPSIGTTPDTDFDKSMYSWSGGVSTSVSQSKNYESWTDINADGLADYLFYLNNKIYVRINNGDSLDLPVGLYIEDVVHQSNSTNVGGQLGGSLGVPISAFKLVGNLRYGYTHLSTKEKFTLRDVNNDGYLDIVKSNGSDSIKVNFCNLSKVNLLKSVTNPTYSEYKINYDLIKSSQKMPNRKYVMSSLLIDDGFDLNDGLDTIQYNFEYKNPFYHRSERSSFGFDTVITKQINYHSQSKYTYRTTTEAYHNDDFMFKGIKKYELISDSLDKKYIETVYTYRKKEIETGVIVPDGQQQCFGPYYPAISKIDKYFYEGLQNYQIHTQQEFIHGKYANVIEFYDFKDTNITDDNISSFITYKTDTIKNILSLADTILVKQNQDLLRKRIAIYNMNIAKPTTIYMYNDATPSRTDISYNNYGLIASITYPENSRNERLNYEYNYDNVVQTYPVNITDNFGQYIETEYDFRLGVPNRISDIAGNFIEYSYHNDGRLETIRGPNEISNNIPFLIKYLYYDINGGLNKDTMPWASTIHYDTLNSGNYFINVIFTDGLGRVVQSKQKSTIQTSPGQVANLAIVSGKKLHDNYGRPSKIYKPITESLSNLYMYNSGISTVNPTKITYDVLDRKTNVKMPDNTQSSFQYGFGNDAFGIKQFKTSVTDPNNNTVHSYTSAMGKQTTIAAPENATTKFIYGPLGELIESIDPESNSTTYEYDMLGQLTQRDHPDAGTTKYQYDRSGNLLSVQTPNLDVDKIEYDYYYNRLMKVNYPENPQNNIEYEYGDSGNETGRITKVFSNGNIKRFSYGNLGEITEEITTFVRPSGETYSFAMQTQYDSWNRILSMTYPDGEVVNYDYNLGGDLIAVQGEKGGVNYSYIDDIHYDKYGNQVFVQNGNGSYSNYTYDQTTLRLANLKTYDGNSNKILDLEYNYDDASNITAIANSASQVNGLGGDFSYSYEYDNLYRLASSSGSFDNNHFTYSLGMSYSASGNILSKNLTANTQIGGLEEDINRRYAYTYNQNQPHTINYVQNDGSDINFSWDENGNLTNYNDPDKRITRNLCWDEENRLTTVKDNNYLSQYTYDAGGERVWKLTGEVSRMTINGEDYFDVADLNNATLYASPYLVVNRQEYTKHIYAGSKRIVSKLGVGLESSIVDPLVFTVEYDVDEYGDLGSALQEYLDNSLSCAEIGPENVSRDINLEIIEQNHATPAEEEERDIYFYHTDHLGSSSWITYTDGSVTQHMQSLPFGEPFIDQRATSYDIRYKFTGKEMDTETGYQYFGARYYNSDISVWLSVDPASELYPNESSYCYAGLNPIMITDPNGMWKDEGDGNWTAEKGDSWWKLHKQSGMSWEETMDYAKKYNADKGRDNWKSVRVGDQVSVPRSEKESSSASGGGENASASTSTSNYLPTPISSSGETANPAQTINNVNSIINVFLTSAQATLQSTRIGSNLSFVIANNKLALNGVTNGLKFAPYIGLGVTTLTGSYLSKTINPTTGRPYQSWLETGFDSGASAATIVIAAKYGGWFGAGAAMLYIGGKEGIKANVRTVRKHPDRFLPASVHCFTR